MRAGSQNIDSQYLFTQSYEQDNDKLEIGLEKALNEEDIKVLPLQKTQIKNKQFRVPNFNSNFVPIVVDNKTKMLGMPSIQGNALFEKNTHN